MPHTLFGNFLMPDALPDATPKEISVSSKDWTSKLLIIRQMCKFLQCAYKWWKLPIQVKSGHKYRSHFLKLTASSTAGNTPSDICVTRSSRSEVCQINRSWVTVRLTSKNRMHLRNLCMRRQANRMSITRVRLVRNASDVIKNWNRKVAHCGFYAKAINDF